MFPVVKFGLHSKKAADKILYFSLQAISLQTVADEVEAESEK